MACWLDKRRQVTPHELTIPLVNLQLMPAFLRAPFLFWYSVFGVGVTYEKYLLHGS